MRSRNYDDGQERYRGQMMRWTLALMGVTGAILNAAHMRVSFMLWMMANCGWVAVFIQQKKWPETFLFIVYLATSIIGWILWGEGVA